MCAQRDPNVTPNEGRHEPEFISSTSHQNMEPSILTKTNTPEPFSRLLTTHWLDLATRLATQKTTVLDGQNLTIAAVVLTARYGGKVTLDPVVVPAIERSSATLKDMVRRNISMYGVNTGFGGSADVRTNDYKGLQSALLTMLQYGIVSNDDIRRFNKRLSQGKDLSALVSETAASLDSGRPNKDMPLAWVRGTMAVRVNSLCQGVSGIAPETVQVLINLLDADIVPQVPLRGSISASGDLSPLSYIAGVMQGSPGVKAYKDGELVPSNIALSQSGIVPAEYGAKEALAIVNGTATSAAVGALAVHETLQLAALSQILTAMSVEAMGGTIESFDAFIANVRPHPGQVDSARSIRGFLRSSKLTSNEFAAAGTLRQDRYALRTSSQWIGPALEDLQLAFQQLTTEINSVTDNPLIDSERQRVLGGGNFQAKAVSCAMEKTRQACQTIGKMLFAQCTEMINPATNRGLPPNLVSDEPSTSFLFKGADMMVAALSSELGFLSTPVNYIEHAEMGNQAINSMALVSARYTLEAADVLAQLVATHLGAVCQALDLRVMHRHFLQALRPVFDASFAELVGTNIVALEHLWAELQKSLDATTNLDSADRITGASKSLQRHLIDHLSSKPEASTTTTSLADLKRVTESFATSALAVYRENHRDYMASPDASPYLGAAGKVMYQFIRKRLGVPFASEASMKGSKMAYGTSVQSPIYAAIRSGAFWPVVVECFQDVERANVVSAKL